MDQENIQSGQTLEQPFTPQEPKKKNNLLFCIIAGAIGIAAIVAIVIFLVILASSKKEEPVKNIEQPVAQEEKEKPKKDMTAAEKEAVIKSVLADFKSAAKTAVDDIDLTFQDIYDTNSPYYLPKNANTGIMLDKSFGIHFASKNTEDLAVIEKVAEAVRNELDELGFVEYDKIALMGGPQYLDEEKNVICGVITTSLPFEVTCGHTSWITTEKLAFINSLAEAYYKKEGKYPIALNASKDAIKDSVFEPYQRLEASMPGAGAIFYRPSKTADWVFFTAGQAAPTCAEFSKDAGARRAFQGQTCVNNSGELETITAG